MTDARARFIRRVSDRIGDGLPVNAIRPITPEPVVPIGYVADGDPVDRFRASARTAGAEIVEATSGDLPRVIWELVQTSDARRIAASEDLLEPVQEAVAGRHVEMVGLDVGSLANCELGFTGVAGAVAVTGTIVIDSSVRGARLCSLLPDTHVAVVETGQIVPTPGDIWRRFDGPDPERLPSNLVFVTGPSRSADIELTLTIGVHGPRRLVIVLVAAA